MSKSNGAVVELEVPVEKSDAAKKSRAEKRAARKTRVQSRTLTIQGQEGAYKLQILVGEQVAYTLALNTEDEVKQFLFLQVTTIAGPLTVIRG